MKGQKSLLLILFIANLALAQYDGTENLFLGK